MFWLPSVPFLSRLVYPLSIYVFHLILSLQQTGVKEFIFQIGNFSLLTSFCYCCLAAAAAIPSSPPSFSHLNLSQQKKKKKEEVTAAAGAVWGSLRQFEAAWWWCLIPHMLLQHQQHLSSLFFLICWQGKFLLSLSNPAMPPWCCISYNHLSLFFFFSHVRECGCGRIEVSELQIAWAGNSYVGRDRQKKGSKCHVYPHSTFFCFHKEGKLSPELFTAWSTALMMNLLFCCHIED